MVSGIKSYVILFLGVLALSTSAIFVRLADAPSAVIAFYRLLLAALVLLPFLLANRNARRELRGITRRQAGQIGMAGFLLALHYVLWFESLRFTSTASSTVIVCLQPLFSLALERFVQKKRIRAAAVPGCLIALLGCVLIGVGDLQISGLSLWGDVLAFIAAGVIALYYFVGESVRKEMTALPYSAAAYLVSAGILLVYILLLGQPLGGFGGQTWLAFAGIALVATIGGQFIFNLLLKKLPASAVTMGILGEPVGTCLLAWLLLGEGLRPQQLIGIGVIMVGMVIFFLPEKGKG